MPQLNDQHRPFPPFRVWPSDYRNLSDGGMKTNYLLDLSGVDPFAA